MTPAQKFLAAVLAGLLPLPASAAWAPTAAEMATLPAYCSARFDEGSEAFKSWRSTMGDDFIHIHHYCAGLNFLSQARGAFSRDKGGLNAAVREFDYVLTHASPDFYLRSEILMNRGIALSMLKRDGEAVGNLTKAIELDAKQPRAYVTLADLYEKQKNRAKALATLREGLSHNPGVKSLQRRYTELGGKLPYPAPIEPAPAAAETTPGAPAAASSANPAAPDTAAPGAATSGEAPTKIGSPKNPYCRFCPD